MSSQDSSRDYDLLDRLVEEFNNRFRRGERPSVQEYCERYPALADELRDLLPAVAQVEHAKEAVADDDRRSFPPVVPPLEHLGDFHILREIGRGGMGVVYEAEQVSLGRRVALKVLGQRLPRDDKQKRRFEREAKAAAKLHHTNIVPVFGTGEENGTPYYVMQFIQGMGLDAVIDELARMGPSGVPAGPTVTAPQPASRDVSAAEVARSLLAGEFPDASAEPDDVTVTAAGFGHAVVGRSEPPGRIPDKPGLSSSVTLPGQGDAGGRGRKLTYWQSVARIGVQVSNALEYAHRQGVLHRDIKPSNLLLDLKGTVWVTDFGLAKAEGTDNLTHTGDILGTLRYMPLEAFDGKADARSDVYSLGLTLYELAARRPAYDERNRQKLVKLVTTTDPARLRAVATDVPRDLTTIVEKAIEKDTARRYATAAELEADLQRFLDDEPILARRQTHLERYRRWARRNPGIAVMGAVLTAVLVVTTVASLIVAGRMTTLARNEARAAADERAARLDADAAEKREAAERERAVNAKIAAQESRKNALMALEKAEESYARARAAVNEYLTAVSGDDRLKDPGLGSLRAELLQSALGFYQEFLKERRDDPGLRKELAGVYSKVGTIQRELGQPSDESFSQARRVYEQLLAATPDDREATDGLARSLYELRRYDEAAGLWEKLVRPDSPSHLYDLGLAYNQIATSYASNGAQTADTGRIPDAAKQLEYLRKSLTIRERLVGFRPNDAEARHGLSMSLNNIANALTAGEHDEERYALYRRAVAEKELAVKFRPRDMVIVGDLATHVWYLANEAARRGNTDEAIAAYTRVTEVQGRLAREQPDNARVTSNTARAYRVFVAYLQVEGRLDLAARVAREGSELVEKLSYAQGHASFDVLSLRLQALAIARAQARDDDSARADRDRIAAAAVAALRCYILSGHRLPLSYFRGDSPVAPLADREDLQAVHVQLAVLLRSEYLAKQPQTPAAERVEACRQCRDALQALAAGDPSSRLALQVLAAAHQDLAKAHLEAGHGEPARAAVAEALALRLRLVELFPMDEELAVELARSQAAVGDSYVSSGKLADAARFHEQAIAGLEDRLRRYPKNARVRAELSRLHIAVGRSNADVGLTTQAIQHFRRGFEVQTPSEYLYWYDFAVLQLENGDEKGYLALVEAAVAQGGRFDGRDGIHRARVLLATAPISDRHRAVLESLPERFVWAPKSESAPPSWQDWVRGFALVRLGRAEAGRVLLERSEMQAHESLKWSALALAYHQLGRGEDARRALDRADGAVTSRMQEFAAKESLVKTRWFEDWLLERALQREAYRTVLGRPVPVSPYERLHHGRVLLAQGDSEKAEDEFAAAARPDDAEVWLARVQLFARLGLKEKWTADLDRAKRLTSAGARTWVATGRTLAAIGEREPSDMAFARAASLAGGKLNPFLRDGWWVVGPYPNYEYAILTPPDYPDAALTQDWALDPSRPLELTMRSSYRSWRPVPTRPDTGVIAVEDISSAATSRNHRYYCLAYVHGEKERTATLVLRSGSRVRLWVNGRLTYDDPGAAELAKGIRVPVLLKAGRNTLLVRVHRQDQEEPFCECTFDDREQPDPATDDFAVAVAADPDRPWPWIERGWYLGTRGRRDEAAQAFARAVELKPNDPQVLARRGLAYAELGWWDAAAADFARALELRPVASPSWVSFATSIQDAIVCREELFARVSKLRPDDRQLWIQRVHYLGRSARWPEAMTAMTRVLKLDPDDHLTWHILPSLRLKLGDREGYRADCREMMKRFGSTTHGLVAQRIATAGLQGPDGVDDPAAVAAMLNRNVKVPMSEVWLEATQGLLDYRLGRYEQAEKSLVLPSQAGYLAADFGRCARAMALYKLGRADEARKALEESRAALAQYPRSGPDLRQPLWFHRLQVEQLLHEADALIPSAPTVATTQRTTPDDDPARQGRRERADRVTARQALALIQQSLGKKDAVEAEFREIVKERAVIAAEEPTNPASRSELGESHERLGRLLIELNRIDDGFEELRRAAAIIEKPTGDSSRRSSARINLALAFLDGGKAAQHADRSAEATQAYRTAVALIGIDPAEKKPGIDGSKATAADWLVLALGQSRLGEADAARASRRRAMDLLKPAGADAAVRPSLRAVVLDLGILSPEATELLAAAAGQLPAGLNQAIQQSPKNPQGYQARGDWYAQRGAWKAAAADYTELTRLERDSLSDYRLAMLYLASGDPDRYHEQCRSILARWGSTELVSEAEPAIKACLVVPGPKFDPKTYSRLAQFSVRRGPDGDRAYRYLFAKGLFELRSGRYAEALADCRESRNLVTSASNDREAMTAQNLCVEAMAHHHAGEFAEAARELELARAILARHVPGIDPGLRGVEHDWLAANLLYREAARLIDANPAGKRK